MLRTSRIAPLVAVALLICGCNHAPQRRYVDQNMDFGSFKTVLILPFGNLSHDSLAGDRVRDVFASMLLATGAFYVLPNGEVARGMGLVGVGNPAMPTVEEVTKLGQTLKADAVFTGLVKEYGEVRSGQSSGNVVSLSAQLQETATGRIVWSASTTKGGITFGARLLGGGGAALNDITEQAVDDLLEQLFK